jgi:sphingomyelin phosphodiesterase acid-like 3
LRNELTSAKNHHQQVIIAMHIPPGIDVYATLKLRLFRLVSLWKQNYTQQFENVLAQFAPEVSGVLAGHLHSDWSQVITLQNKAEIPISGTTSISPIFGNNPGFKIYTYSAEHKLDSGNSFKIPLSMLN